MKNYFPVLIFFLILFYSCKPVINAVYGINNYKEFTDLKDYGNFVEKKSGVDLAHFYYLDEASYHQFWSIIEENKVNYYLGTYINDSTRIKKSDFLLDNQSCSGRVITDINSSLNGLDELITTEDKTFTSHTFYNIVTGEPLQFLNDGRVTVVMVYSSQLGSAFKSQFRQIQETVNSLPKHDLIVISLDDVLYGS